MAEHGRGFSPLSVLKDPLKRFKTAEEASHELTRLKITLLNLRKELAERNRTDGFGRRLSPQEYHSWRAQAREDLATTESEYVRLKEMVKRGAFSSAPSPADVRDPRP